MSRDGCTRSALRRHARAASTAAPMLAGVPPSGANDYGAFLRLLDAQFRKYEDVLPIDLRVRGVVSTKYAHDGRTIQDNER